jgi:hypothetical protein
MADMGLYGSHGDWSKAPEDATHYRPESNSHFAMWYKPGYYWHKWNFAWQELPADSELELHNMHPRPVTLQNPNARK